MMLSSVGRGGRYRSQSIGSGDNNKTIGPTLGGVLVDVQWQKS